MKDLIDYSRNRNWTNRYVWRVLTWAIILLFLLFCWWFFEGVPVNVSCKNSCPWCCCYDNLTYHHHTILVLCCYVGHWIIYLLILFQRVWPSSLGGQVLHLGSIVKLHSLRDSSSNCKQYPRTQIVIEVQPKSQCKSLLAMVWLV